METHLSAIRRIDDGNSATHQLGDREIKIFSHSYKAEPHGEIPLIQLKQLIKLIVLRHNRFSQGNVILRCQWGSFQSVTYNQETSGGRFLMSDIKG